MWRPGTRSANIVKIKNPSNGLNVFGLQLAGFGDQFRDVWRRLLPSARSPRRVASRSAAAARILRTRKVSEAKVHEICGRVLTRKISSCCGIGRLAALEFEKPVIHRMHIWEIKIQECKLR
jgi:hypothetical protein